jgi:hypothetical protein
MNKIAIMTKSILNSTLVFFLSVLFTHNVHSQSSVALDAADIVIGDRVVSEHVDIAVKLLEEALAEYVEYSSLSALAQGSSDDAIGKFLSLIDTRAMLCEDYDMNGSDAKVSSLDYALNASSALGDTDALLFTIESPKLTNISEDDGMYIAVIRFKKIWTNAINNGELVSQSGRESEINLTYSMPIVNSGPESPVITDMTCGLMTTTPDTSTAPIVTNEENVVREPVYTQNTTGTIVLATMGAEIDANVSMSSIDAVYRSVQDALNEYAIKGQLKDDNGLATEQAVKAFKTLFIGDFVDVVSDYNRTPYDRSASGAYVVKKETMATYTDYVRSYAHETGMPFKINNARAITVEYESGYYIVTVEIEKEMEAYIDGGVQTWPENAKLTPGEKVHTLSIRYALDESDLAKVLIEEISSSTVISPAEPKTHIFQFTPIVTLGSLSGSTLDFPGSPGNDILDLGSANGVGGELKWMMNVGDKYAQEKPWFIHAGIGFEQYTLKAKLTDQLAYNYTGPMFLGEDGIPIDSWDKKQDPLRREVFIDDLEESLSINRLTVFGGVSYRLVHDVSSPVSVFIDASARAGLGIGSGTSTYVGSGFYNIKYGPFDEDWFYSQDRTTLQVGASKPYDPDEEFQIGSVAEFDPGSSEVLTQTTFGAELGASLHYDFGSRKSKDWGLVLGIGYAFDFISQFAAPGETTAIFPYYDMSDSRVGLTQTSLLSGYNDKVTLSGLKIRFGLTYTLRGGI